MAALLRGDAAAGRFAATAAANPMSTLFRRENVCLQIGRDAKTMLPGTLSVLDQGAAERRLLLLWAPQPAAAAAAAVAAAAAGPPMQPQALQPQPAPPMLSPGDAAPSVVPGTLYPPDFLPPLPPDVVARMQMTSPGSLASGLSGAASPAPAQSPVMMGAGFMSPSSSTASLPSAESSTTGADDSLARYTIRVPVANISSILRRHPTLGITHIIISTRDGVSFPPLFFFSGGTRELLGTLKNFMSIQKSKQDSNLFLLQPLADSAPADDRTSTATSGRSRLVRRMNDFFSRVLDRRNSDVSSSASATRTSSNTGVPTPHRSSPVTPSQYASLFDADGRLVRMAELRRMCFFGGLTPSLRQDAWKFLLGVYAPETTRAERAAKRQELEREYHRLKANWMLIVPADDQQFAKFKERRMRIEKDVVRTDRNVSIYMDENSETMTKMHNVLLTYSCENFELGYCQGMNDFLSPVLYVMQDEVDTYWTFVALMRRVERNFHKDQKGMSRQLAMLRRITRAIDGELFQRLVEIDADNMYFTFRWILVQFKREFPFDEIQTLWDVMWTDFATVDFHLFCCLACVLRVKPVVMDANASFDDLLQFFNSHSQRWDLKQMLLDAERLVYIARSLGEELDASNDSDEPMQPS